MDMKNLGWLLTGAFCGIALVLSCHPGPPLTLDAALSLDGALPDGAIANADAAPDAAPADCAVWQFAGGPATSFAGGGSVQIGTQIVGVYEVPAGWEPFGASSSEGILIRRCKP